MPEKSYSLAELAEILHCECIGLSSYRISGVNSLDKASPSDVSFLANPRYREAMLASSAGVICIDRQTVHEEGKNYLISDEPSRSFQILAELFLRQKKTTAFTGIHPTAVIHSSAKIGQDVTLGPYVVIDAEVCIGDRTRIGASSFIGLGVEIGTDCHLFPSTVVREWCRLGNRVILQSGCVVGSCGFGYTTDKKGLHHKLEQLGIVIIEDDVEIGANATIDRSRFDATIIRRGTKIDNLVQIAHNVEIGSDNLIAAQTGIAGSSKTGHHVMMGGQTGIVGHVTIADLTMLASKSGISKSIGPGKFGGSPALPINEHHRQEAHTRRIEEYVKRIKALEEKVSKGS